MTRLVRLVNRLPCGNVCPLRTASCVGAAALAAMLVAVPARPETPAATAPTVAAGIARPAAVPAPRIGSDCAGEIGISGTAASVIDGRTFLFGDGREMRLAAIETPPLASPDTAREDAGIAAKAALEALLLHRPVVVRPAGTASDRYGRLIVYAFAAAPETFVQREMLAQGYALLSPAAAEPRCRSLLRVAERSARTAKPGLWGDPYYEVKQADNPADVLAERGRFAVVAGLVASVRESGGIVYMNFGRRWSEDFTSRFSSATSACSPAPASPRASSPAAGSKSAVGSRNTADPPSRRPGPSRSNSSRRRERSSSA